MSNLLTLENVSKRYPRGAQTARERIALRDVSLALAPGEFVAVWGRRRSGRTTLLEVCAGLEKPTEGSVRFAGHDLAHRRLLGKREGIGFAQPHFSRMHGVVVEQVATPMLKTRARVECAQMRAFELLDRVGVAGCAEMSPDELEPSEVVRVMLARALMMQPRLVLLDAPTSGVPAPERDAIFSLLRTLTREAGPAVLMTVDEVPGLATVADRLLAIGGGELRGATAPAEPAPVLPLRRAEPSA
ncbi:MAG: ATP-binding cassette domain-containing protein [Actinobacteria bacterium]|nr:ATP-binding cassette domain-containing protein [Actinomycetota bacterium]